MTIITALSPMRSKSFRTRLRVSLLLTFTMTAQPLVAEDLMELWEVAVQTDGKYLAAQYQYLANTEAIKQTRAQLLPNISYQFEERETSQDIVRSDNPIYDTGSSDYGTTTNGIVVTQSVFDYSRWKRYSQSKITVDQAEVEYDLAKQQLLVRLAEAYFLVLERGDQLNTIQIEKTAMNRHLKLAEAKLKSGMGKRVDVEDARARSLNAVAKEFELQSMKTDSEYALREVVGTVPRELLVLRPNIALEKPVPDSTAQWIETATQHSLELRVMILELDLAQEEIKVLKGGHYPTLELVLNAVNTETDGSVYGGGSEIENADIALKLNFPLFSGGAVSSQVRQATQKRYSVLEELNDKRRAVERETQDAFNRIHTAIVQIGALEQSVTAQKRLLQSRESGYRTGKNSILKVLDVQNDLSRVQQALTKSRYDYVLNTLRLKYAVGDLQVDDLALVNSWLK